MDHVQWIGTDGGWKTGRVVKAKLSPWFEVEPITVLEEYLLVKHDHTGELEFVSHYALQRRPMRSDMAPEFANPWT